MGKYIPLSKAGEYYEDATSANNDNLGDLDDIQVETTQVRCNSSAYMGIGYMAYIGQDMKNICKVR